MNKKTLKETLLTEIEKMAKKRIRITNVDFVCECEDHYELAKSVSVRGAFSPVSDIIIDITRITDGEIGVEKLKSEKRKELEETLGKIVDYAQRYEINKFNLFVIPLTGHDIDEPVKYVQFMIMFNYKKH